MISNLPCTAIPYDSLFRTIYAYKLYMIELAFVCVKHKQKYMYSVSNFAINLFSMFVSFLSYFDDTISTHILQKTQHRRRKNHTCKRGKLSKGKYVNLIK